jgi:hypothetical protein
MSKKDEKKKEGDKKEEKDEKHLKDELPELEKKERKKKDKKESVEGKAKVEAVLEDESSSEEEAVKVTRVGYVEMKSKKEWKAVYCVLIGGSLYWSKSSTDPEPKGSIDLKAKKLEFNIKGLKKDFAFSVAEDKNELFVGACSNEAELNSWKKDLEAALTKDHVDAPTVLQEKKKKEGAMSRAKKNIASKTATSALGKKVMKTIVNEETTTLINSLKKIIRKESGNPKRADEIEKNIIKIAVKAYLLVDNGTLTADDFLVADKPLREAFELMIKIFNGRNRVKKDRILEAIDKVVDLLKKAEEIVTNLLAPQLTSKNMIRISASFASIANRNFMEHVYADAELEPDLEKLIDAMEYYTQFHYHKG